MIKETKNFLIIYDTRGHPTTRILLSSTFRFICNTYQVDYKNINSSTFEASYLVRVLQFTFIIFLIFLS